MIYTKKLNKMYSSLGFFELINSLSSIALAHFFVTPYYIGYHFQNRSRKLIDDVSRAFFTISYEESHQKIALFTDTLHEINGVAITIKRILEMAQQRGVDLVVITSTMEESSLVDGIKNFKAIGDFSLPEYPDLRMCFPPILDLIDYFEKEEFTRIHVSTPGSVGLIGLLLSRLMDVPITGTYHTDIPQYVRDLTNDVFLESVAWNFMIWFYNMMDEVTVPSISTQNQLIQRGLDEKKVKYLPRWVNTNVYKPENRNPHIWHDFDFHESLKFLYVGRASKEKNLELLAQAFINIIDSGYKAGLVVVGDGPYREDLEEKLRDYPVLFTGFQIGETLTTLYASSDVFVFPSTTDTFGNVVLEAQASGLPVIVSDQGGPQELMINGETGIIVKSNDSNSLTQAMLLFINDNSKIRLMGQRARNYMVHKGINNEEIYSTILYNNQKLSSDYQSPAVVI
jgi:glycosyltransferase involved in cell wall biosynthesis